MSPIAQRSWQTAPLRSTNGRRWLPSEAAQALPGRTTILLGLLRPSQPDCNLFLLFFTFFLREAVRRLDRNAPPVSRHRMTVGGEI
jgi:hypothetical protein